MLVSGEAREFVADFDDSELIGLKEEANVAVVDYWYFFVLGVFFGS